MDMVQNILKRNVPLPQRPILPGVDELIADVQRSHEDDVVFTILNDAKNADSGESLISADSYSMDDSHTSSNPAEDTAQDHVNKDVDLVYKKTLTFLEKTEDLKLAPETLKGQVHELKKMGEELSDSISDFKEQSRNVLNQSQEAELSC